jgi:hypothetical protein
MTVREWAIKAGELKALNRTGRLLFAARCALRVEPWVPEDLSDLWLNHLGLLVNAAFEEPVLSAVAEGRRRTIAERGATAQNRHEASDEPTARAMGYSAQTLALGLGATALPAGTELTKEVIGAAKMAASIAALIAHAGRVEAPAGEDAVTFASVTTWDAMRADIPLLVEALPTLSAPNAKDRLGQLRALGPLWPTSPEALPSWGEPPKPAKPER